MNFALFAAYLLAACFIIMAATFGLFKELGAHPFWDQKVAWTGASVGFVIGMASVRLPAQFRLLASTFGLLASSGAVYFGKQRFVASYAEDVLAGQFWFFGWIAVSVFATVLVGVLLLQGLSK